MRSKVPVGKSSLRPHVQVNNHGRINSPGDDIRVAIVKNASKAGSPTAASGASCDRDDGDEENADDAEEDWPENGHDDSASGDELGPADIEEDNWWNRPVGSNDESDKVAADAVLFDEEGGDHDPWSLGTDDDVSLLKRRLRHRLQSKSERARVVLSDDDGPGEERRPILTAAEKGKAKVAEAPAKAPTKAPACRCKSNKKWTSDGYPRSSKGAAKKKAKKAPNPDDIVVNETLGSHDDPDAALPGPGAASAGPVAYPCGPGTALPGPGAALPGPGADSAGPVPYPAPPALPLPAPPPSPRGPAVTTKPPAPPTYCRAARAT
ncbi:unnamed protein product [Closterium sp. NIES-65]|nr:unnamed protein product [Closterium sp. NIES-65]